MNVRPAVHEDIPELVRLRQILADRMARDGSYPVDAHWHAAYAASLGERLDDPDTAVRVIDAAEGGLTACGIGMIFDRLPGPASPDGRCGYIQGMVTDPRHRRRGHSRAIMTTLMDWYRGNGVRKVDLHAIAEAEPLYREFGFTDDGYPSFTWYRPS